MSQKIQFQNLNRNIFFFCFWWPKHFKTFCQKPLPPIVKSFWEWPFFFFAEDLPKFCGTKWEKKFFLIASEISFFWKIQGQEEKNVALNFSKTRNFTWDTISHFFNILNTFWFLTQVSLSFIGNAKVYFEWKIGYKKAKYTQHTNH